MQSSEKTDRLRKRVVRTVAPGVNENNPYIKNAAKLREALFGNEKSDDRDDNEGGQVKISRVGDAKETLAELPAEARMKARMVEARGRAFREGFDAAQEYLDGPQSGRRTM